MANGQTARKREAPATAVMRRHRSSEPASSRPSQIQADRAALVQAPRSGPLSDLTVTELLRASATTSETDQSRADLCSLRLRPNRPIRGAGRVRSGPRHERRASRGRAPSILRSRWAPLTGIAAGCLHGHSRGAPHQEPSSSGSRWNTWILLRAGCLRPQSCDPSDPAAGKWTSGPDPSPAMPPCQLTTSTPGPFLGSWSLA